MWVLLLNNFLYVFIPLFGFFAAKKITQIGTIFCHNSLVFSFTSVFLFVLFSISNFISLRPSVLLDFHTCLYWFRCIFYLWQKHRDTHKKQVKTNKYCILVEIEIRLFLAKENTRKSIKYFKLLKFKTIFLWL